MNKLRLGMLGLHFGRHIIAEHLISGSAAPFFELAAVCDRVPERAAAVAAEFHTRACADLDDLLADPRIDVVGLFTGPVGRAGLIRRIIHAGKDVMTTKPLELDPAAALDVLNEAQQLGRVVHLNSPAPTLPADIRQIRTWQQELNLGQPVAARWETWVRYHEQDEGSWYDDPAQCPAAPVFRLGIYAINDILALLGEPDAVQLMQTRVFTGRPTADNAQLTLRFTNGALANIYASFCVDDGRKYPNNLVVNYARGTVYRTPGSRDPDGGKTLRLRLLVQSAADEVVEQSVQVPVAAASGNYQWENFYRAVGGETLPGALTPAETMASIRVIAAMLRAQHSGQLEPV